MFIKFGGGIVLHDDVKSVIPVDCPNGSYYRIDLTHNRGCLRETFGSPTERSKRVAELEALLCEPPKPAEPAPAKQE